jgi:hypothetical protein
MWVLENFAPEVVAGRRGAPWACSGRKGLCHLLLTSQLRSDCQTEMFFANTVGYCEFIQKNVQEKAGVCSKINDVKKYLDP